MSEPLVIERWARSIPKLDDCQFVIAKLSDMYDDNSNTMIRASQFSGVRLYSRKNIKIV